LERLHLLVSYAANTEQMVTKASLKENIDQYWWFHSIDFGDGIITPGVKTPDIHRLESGAFFDPVDVDGCSVIDIGAWHGFYSFEAKRRGAQQVLATDHAAWNHPTLRGRETFDLARSVLGLDVETLELDVPEHSPERVGMFDVVLFLGVFYHLFDPIDGLTRAASLARDVLVIEALADLHELDRPAMVFYPGREANGDPSNWWGPNTACMIGLLSTLGFAKIDAAYSPLGPGRAVFHAWRSLKRRRSGPPPHLAVAEPKSVPYKGPTAQLLSDLGRIEPAIIIDLRHPAAERRQSHHFPSSARDHQRYRRRGNRWTCAF
jgi:tRNA (mo5U34)-methyltransferase